MPTVLDFLGIREELVLPFMAPRRTQELFPQNVVLDTRRVQLHGRSLLPLMKGETEEIRRYAFTGHYGQQWSIQDRTWRLLVDLDGVPGAWVSAHRSNRPPQLYHRPADPGDQKNVAGEHAEVIKELELELWRWAGALS